MNKLTESDFNQTEQKIIYAAREIFARKGFYGARMHEISERAGINSALLHYYFRNKKKLFEKVFEQLITELIDNLFSNNSELKDLDKFIFKFSENYIEFFHKNQNIPLFVIQEFRDNPEWIFNTLKKTQLSERTFFKDIAKLNVGSTIFKHDFEPFINLVSMLLFPIIARPLVQFLLNVNDEDYDKMIESRKLSVPQFILNNFNPKKVSDEK
ncbi:MAG: hypothetical protein A2X64_07140 [Ignavibacteria bacterium GWF2_33_9]|nr:MAG: hypothetical protein A2X64_07140 [Ignavibacteria bacterium GWF2_33_9]